MVATFWLLGWVLVPVQMPSRPAPSVPATTIRSDWVLTPRFTRGQELVYKGTYTEAATGARVEFQRSYQLESRCFILNTPPKGVEVSVMTLLRERNPNSKTLRLDSTATSIQLEKLTLDSRGKVASPPSMSVPLEGPPSLEVGMFIEVPTLNSPSSQEWDTSDPGRPPISWRFAGTESVAGQLCAKFVGVQQTNDWELPRADRSAWRRQETVWISVRSGIAQRLERVIEHHEPARQEVSRRAILRYELESSLQLPGSLALDRRQELQQALSYREAAAPLLGEPVRHLKQLQDLQRRIDQHLENPPTPYRDVVLQIKRQVDAACKGEVATASRPETPERAVTAAVTGEAAPDFVAGPISSTEPGRLSKWRGNPVLLVFYHPGSFTAPDVLRFAQSIHADESRPVTVVGLPIIDDPEQVLAQRAALSLEFPLYSGGGMRISYGVETTPKIVLIDSVGIIRGAYLGWGRETGNEIMNDLRRWSTPPR